MTETVALDVYRRFLDSKSQIGINNGFKPLWIPDFLFDFQAFLCDWKIYKGRGATLVDCGMGKTPMQLVYAENVVRHTNGRVLISTPLAVSFQTVKEAAKFGIECERSTGRKTKAKITVTNYQQLRNFNPSDFVCFIGDESGILKNFDGVTKDVVTEFMRKLPYRGLYTATAAPNDYHELGTHSEALGYLGYMDMLNRFFKNDSSNSAIGRSYGEVVKWRFKGHAEIPFIRWVCSWAISGRKPSDWGFNDGAFVLPPIEYRNHILEAKVKEEGFLFARAAVGMKEQREEKRRTIEQRCEKVAKLANTGKPFLVWCDLDAEANLVEQLVPDCVQVSGDDGDEAREEKFSAFISGQKRGLVTKRKIGAWGLNFQHCPHIIKFPTHSYEQDYQGDRRCWRFGQKHKVIVDRVLTEGEIPILHNMERKAEQAGRMFDLLVRHMNDELHIDRDKLFPETEMVPSWL